MRIVLLVVHGLLCASALYLFVYREYRFERTILAVAQRTSAAEKAADYLAAGMARENLRRLGEARRCCGPQLNVLLLEGDNLVMLSRIPEAIAKYEEALAIQPRPEIYYSLAVLLARQGRMDEAVEAFVRCVRFDPARQTDVDVFSNDLAVRVRQRVLTAEGGAAAPQ